MKDYNELSVPGTLDLELVAGCEQFIAKTPCKFWLYNRERNHWLEFINRKDEVLISGSWRKWYFGADSTKDLTPRQIVDVSHELSKVTGISGAALLDGRYKRLEIGFSFALPLFPSTVLDSMFRYSTFELGKYDTSISFRGQEYWLGLYDKTVEVNKRRRKRDEAEIVNDEHVLRIEIKTNKSACFQSKLRGIRTPKELVTNYRMLVVTLLQEIKRIEMKPISLIIADMSLDEMNAKDYRNHLTYAGLDRRGMRGAFKDIEKLGVSRKSKTDLRNFIRNLNARYDKYSTLTRKDFLDEIIKPQLASKITFAHAGL